MASTIEVKKRARDKFVAYAPSNRRIRLIYDRGVDVLYINFVHSKPDKADYGTQRGDYILRYKNEHLIGVTILNTASHFENAFADFPL